MREGWTSTPLGALLTMKRRAERIEPEAEYKQLTIAVNGNGVRLRKVVAGRDLGTAKFVCRSGDLMVSKIDARKGACAVLPSDLDGVVVTSDFLSYQVNSDLVDSTYLDLWVRRPAFAELCDTISSGTTNRIRMDIGRFPLLELPLPPLPVQRRIVDLIGALDETIAASHAASVSLASKRASSNGAEGSLLAMLLSDETVPRRKVSALGTVTMGRQRSPQHATGSHMAPYLRVANVSDDALRMGNVLTMNFTPDERRRYSLERGDILVSEGQSLELVGESVLLLEGFSEPMFFQNTLIRFRPDQSQVRPAFAQALFRAALRAGLFSGIAKRTTTIAHLGTQRFAELELPVPSLFEQDRFLALYEPLRHAARCLGRQMAFLEEFRSRVVTVLLAGELEIPESYDELLGEAS